jgi:hypothetical protein
MDDDDGGGGERAAIDESHIDSFRLIQSSFSAVPPSFLLAVLTKTSLEILPIPLLPHQTRISR